MQTLADTVFGQTEAFAPTHWSVIVAAGEADEEQAREALAQLCQTYWPPLYTFVRAHGYPRHDAQDLTQGFFQHLIKHRIYARTDRQKGKFRSFLLGSLKNFLADARDWEQALKRGGGREFVPLEENRTAAAESLFQTQHAFDSGGSGADPLFDRTWAETLVSTVLGRVAADYKADGKEQLFQELQTFLSAGAAPLPSYAELASRLGIAEATLRSHVTRLRARYRQILRAEVRRTVTTEAEVDSELRELLRVLT